MPNSPFSVPTRTNAAVSAFLSCSIRPRDHELVDALRVRVLEPMGFKCFTVGRNVSSPDQVDDAVKKLLKSCECLIGVATERLSATDRDVPDQTLRLTTPYLLQETSMAFQADLPFLIIRTPDIGLQGVTARNLYLDIAPTLSNGRVRFKHHPDLVYSSLRDLKQRAKAHAKKRSADQAKRLLGQIATFVVGAGAVVTGVDWLRRPPCFGNFYYKDPACGPCPFKARCKAEKVRRGG